MTSGSENHVSEGLKNTTLNDDCGQPLADLDVDVTRLAGDVHPGRGQQGQGGGGALQAEGVAGGGAHSLGGQTLS